MARHFIRHPAHIPITLQDSSSEPCKDCPSTTEDLSEGGLCCITKEYVAPGTLISLTINVTEPPFKTTGEVVWSRPHPEGHIIGIGFRGDETLFAVRMVEQICHIEQFRQDVLRKEGRTLSTEEAAAEWIAIRAATFPVIGETKNTRH